MQRGMKQTKDESKGGLTRETALQMYSWMYIYSVHVISSNTDLCLGYK
jgi:hypothetical protein